MQRNAQVVQVQGRWKKAQELSVTVLNAPEGSSMFLPGDTLPALSFTDLIGEVQVGDILRIDCSALSKSLGTGGFATVISNTSLPPDSIPPNGHIVKARYMPHQVIVQSVEEPGSAHHTTMQLARTLEGTPVLVADLHSALPAVVAGIRSVRKDARIVYIWQDCAAIPLAFSKTVARLVDLGELDLTITCGQSFGGDLEAVSLPAALLAARHVGDADYIVVAQGPGNLGTSTHWGFSGTATADVLHNVYALGGIPIPVVRASQADARVEHLGISHHCLAVLNELVLISLDVPVVDGTGLDLESQVSDRLATQISELGRRHRIHMQNSEQARAALEHTGVALHTMGRNVKQDALGFVVASAAGIYATTLSNLDRIT